MRHKKLHNWWYPLTGNTLLYLCYIKKCTMGLSTYGSGECVCVCLDFHLPPFSLLPASLLPPTCLPSCLLTPSLFIFKLQLSHWLPHGGQTSRLHVWMWKTCSATDCSSIAVSIQWWCEGGLGVGFKWYTGVHVWYCLCYHYCMLGYTALKRPN